MTQQTTTAAPASFDGSAPPQLVHTVNMLPIPSHDLRGPDDLDGIASFILARAKQGVGDIFAHEDYTGFENTPTEGWARAIAEHQTGIPYTMPAFFYGAQKQVAQGIVQQGRYPLVGQCQQSVTTALCIGGWDGGRYGDIGASKDSQPYCASLGRGWRDVPFDLKKWSDEQWNDVEVGSCLFWSTDSAGVGHVTMVIRKHPHDRKWQLWDTNTSVLDPRSHAAVAKEAQMLWESHWWDYIPRTLSSSWQFRGIGLIRGLGQVRTGLRPRGRTRLLLLRRSDKALLFRSAWIDMEQANLPISWLLRALRGAPFHDRIEARFCVDSTPGLAKNFPRGAPLLDITVDPSGNARMYWNYQGGQGFHERKDAELARPDAPYRQGATGSAASPAQSAPARTNEGGASKSATLGGIEEIDRILEHGGALRLGSRGPGVKALQEALIALGIEIPGGADGLFGKGMAEALKKFQKEADLSPDGIADASTLRALDERLRQRAAV